MHPSIPPHLPLPPLWSVWRSIRWIERWYWPQSPLNCTPNSSKSPLSMFQTTKRVLSSAARSRFYQFPSPAHLLSMHFASNPISCPCITESKMADMSTIYLLFSPSSLTPGTVARLLAQFPLLLSLLPMKAIYHRLDIMRLESITSVHKYAIRQVFCSVDLTDQLPFTFSHFKDVSSFCPGPNPLHLILSLNYPHTLTSELYLSTGCKDFRLRGTGPEETLAHLLHGPSDHHSTNGTHSVWWKTQRKIRIILKIGHSKTDDSPWGSQWKGNKAAHIMTSFSGKGHFEQFH